MKPTGKYIYQEERITIFNVLSKKAVKTAIAAVTCIAAMSGITIGTAATARFILSDISSDHIEPAPAVIVDDTASRFDAIIKFTPAETPMPAVSVMPEALDLDLDIESTASAVEVMMLRASYAGPDFSSRFETGSADSEIESGSDPESGLPHPSARTGDKKLDPRLGVNYGPSGKETWYDLDMSGCIYLMNHLGYSSEDYPYWVRDDGCKMFGDYIMVAADLDIRPKGTIVECSLGTAIVVDTGDLEPYQLDIAVAWNKYRSA